MFQFRAMSRVLLASLACGIGGCYVPNGGWTLRSGIDLRTHKKPAIFTEMVDTHWDEWNRVAQMNAAYGASPGDSCPPVENLPPGTTIISSTANSSDTPDSKVVQTSQSDSSSKEPMPKASKPTGAWLFR